jgi:hypothetical protein
MAQRWSQHYWVTAVAMEDAMITGEFVTHVTLDALNVLVQKLMNVRYALTLGIL